MDAFEAVALVQDRLNSLEETLVEIRAAKHLSYSRERSTQALIEINELMLLALYRTFQGFPIRLVIKAPEVTFMPVYRPDLGKLPNS